MRKRSYWHRSPRWLRGFSRSNVRQEERLASVLLGLGLAALGLRQWRSRGLALLSAALLLRRGVTGACPFYKRLGLSTR